jgi:hypothetical protein
MDTCTYNLVSAALLTLVLAVGIATVCVYYFQLKAMQATIAAQNLSGLIQYLQAVDVRHARHFVLTVLRKRQYALWDDENKELAGTTCAAYGTAGVLIQLGRVESTVILDNWGPSIIEVCDCCHDYINERRAQSGEKYWKALLWLYEQASGKKWA